MKISSLIMTRSSLLQIGFLVLALAGTAGIAAAKKVKEGVTLDVKLNGGRGPGGQMAVGDFQIQHIDGFKGAKRVAISVFNVAFPDDNSLSANLQTKPHSTTSTGYYVTVTTTTSLHKSSTLHTKLQGVDPATRQRITDAAYANFVDELKRAGFEFVSAEELARLTPEYAKWTAVPNFNPGRFGVYVAPTGRSVYYLQGDGAKRDTSGKWGELKTPFRAWDRPQALTRSPYLAYDGNLGIIAVTLVIDYGVYSTTGETSKSKEEVKVEFEKGVTVQSGTLYDTATLAEYWGPKSGGFPAIAALAVPVRSDLPFGEMTGGDGDVVVKADAAQFEKAALDVASRANAKLVAAIAAAR